MATHPKTENAKPTDEAEAKAVAAAPSFPLSRLLRHPEGEFITGLRVHLIAGAFFGESPDSTFTVQQVQDRVQRWLDQPVK